MTIAAGIAYLDLQKRQFMLYAAKVLDGIEPVLVAAVNRTGSHRRGL
ncbi:MAG: hypothetical protein ACHQK9_19960 [Reyranellales bacterium]